MMSGNPKARFVFFPEGEELRILTRTLFRWTRRGERTDSRTDFEVGRLLQRWKAGICMLRFSFDSFRFTLWVSKSCPLHDDRDCPSQHRNGQKQHSIGGSEWSGLLAGWRSQLNPLQEIVKRWVNDNNLLERATERTNWTRVVCCSKPSTSDYSLNSISSLARIWSRVVEYF